jgi:hypothetical protein
MCDVYLAPKIMVYTGSGFEVSVINYLLEEKAI